MKGQQFAKYLTSRPTSRWVAAVGYLLADLVTVWVSLIISLSLVGSMYAGADLHALSRIYFWPIVPVAIGLLAVRRIYRIQKRYLGVYDLVNICLVAGVLAFAVRVFEFYNRVPVAGGSSWTNAVLFGFIAATLMCTTRLYARLNGARHILPHHRRTNGSAQRAIIVGAGDAGETVWREIIKTQNALYHVIGFVDDDPHKQGITIHGVPVRGTVDQLAKLIERHQVQEVMIAIPSASGEQMRRISDQCAKTQARVRTLPSLSTFASGTKRVLPLMRDLQIEDLLGRKQVEGDKGQISVLVSEERVLVTGAGGSIGTELSRQVSRKSPSSLVLLGRGENSIFEIDQELREVEMYDAIPVICDVKDRQALGAVFNQRAPSVVIHAAAHKHVPLMEAVPIEAIRNNVFGTLNVVEEAMRHGVKNFILVSTDKAVNPSSAMGATKRLAEMIVQSAATRSNCAFSIVRFGNVLGSRGSLVPILRKQIERGGPITITTPDMTRYFMSIPEAVQLILQAGAMGDNGEIFVLDMGRPVRIIDLAYDMVRMHGLVPGHDIKVEFTGVRPGEKIHEELSTSSEDLEPSEHDKIHVVSNAQALSWDQLKEYLKELEQKCDEGDADEAKKLLMDLAWGSFSRQNQVTSQRAA